MTEAQLAALSALGGALIGSLGGGVAAVLAYLQSRDVRRSEDRRHAWQLGMELGLKEWEAQSDYIKARGGLMTPPQLHAYFSGRFLELATEGKLTAAGYEQIQKDLDALTEVARKAYLKGREPR